MYLLAKRVSLIMFSLSAQCAFTTISGVASPALADPRVHESVTGHVEFTNTNTGNQVKFSFNAIRHRDGTVSGQFEEHAETATGEFIRRVHGTNICFTVAGNVARLGGIVTHSSGAAASPGTEVFATVVDNGEGANEPPDLASPGGAGDADVHCTTGLPRPLFPVDHGNVQIRPSGF